VITNQPLLLDTLVTIGLSMLPVFELRWAIPYAIGILKMPVLLAFVASLFGNIVAVVVLLKFLDPLIKYLFAHSPFLRKHLEKYFEKLHVRHKESFNEWGSLFLALFVAIPLPGTGGWTGALLAYLFNIPHRFAIPALITGLVGAGVIVVLVTGLFV